MGGSGAETPEKGYDQEEFDKEESKHMSSNKDGKQANNNSAEKYSSDFQNSRRAESKGSKKPSLPGSVKKASSRAYSSIGGPNQGKDQFNESNERIIVEEMMASQAAA